MIKLYRRTRRRIYLSIVMIVIISLCFIYNYAQNLETEENSSLESGDTYTVSLEDTSSDGEDFVLEDSFDLDMDTEGEDTDSPAEFSHTDEDSESVELDAPDLPTEEGEEQGSETQNSDSGILVEESNDLDSEGLTDESIQTGDTEPVSEDIASSPVQDSTSSTAVGESTLDEVEDEAGSGEIQSTGTEDSIEDTQEQESIVEEESLESTEGGNVDSSMEEAGHENLEESGATGEENLSPTLLDEEGSEDSLDTTTLDIQEYSLDEIVELESQDLAEQSPEIMLMSTGTNQVEISSFHVSFRSGADQSYSTNGTILDSSDDPLAEDTYVWTATNSDQGHRFTFRINYTVSGNSNFEPGSVRFKVPKSILKNRTGDPADSYDLSIPMEGDSGITAATRYLAYEDGDDIVIYNRLPIEGSENGYIEIAYLTSERTSYYADYGSANSLSDAFYANLHIEQGDAEEDSTSNQLYLGIDSSATASYTKKGYPDIRYSSWQSAWGNLVKPTNADDYYYLIWEIETRITDITAAYNFTLEDYFETGTDAIVIGYKMEGESIYSSNNTVSNIHPQNSQTALTRYDFVLTAHLKSTYESESSYYIKNYVQAIVDTVDQVDEDSIVYSSRDWNYTDPSFVVPTGAFMLYKWGRYLSAPDDHKHYLRRTDDNLDISSFALGALKMGNAISNLQYETRMDNYQWRWTADLNGSIPEGGTSPLENPDNYGRVNVRTVFYDNEFYLDMEELDPTDPTTSYNTADKLGSEDYQLDKITFYMHSREATYVEDTKSFEHSPTNFTAGDTIDFFGEFDVDNDGQPEWVHVATYDLYNKTYAFVDNTYVKDSSGQTIEFVDNCTGWKAEYENAYYSNSLTVYPYITLKSSENVRNKVSSLEKVNLLNLSRSEVFCDTDGDGSEESLIEFMRTASDWISNVEKYSYISKTVSNYQNNKANRYYSISWNSTAYEFYFDSLGTRTTTLQDSGVFYDLLPLGASLSTDSLKVYGDGSLLDASKYSYTYIGNYQNSGRDLIVVRISESANVYRLAYDSIHTWDAIREFGSNVVNDIAYETGNDNLADAHPDNGGDSGVSEFYDLDPDALNGDESDYIAGSGDKFIYAKNSYSIDTVINSNLGLYKRVKDQSDADYRFSTTTYNDSIYSYMIRFATDDVTKAKDLILFDSLENYSFTDDAGSHASDWRGTLQSIDLSSAREQGVEPVVYLSRVENLDMTVEGNRDITNTAIWSEMSTFGDISDAKAVAIDLRYTSAGEAFLLDSDTAISVELFMKAPHSVTKQVGKTSYMAYNNIYLSETLIAADGLEVSDFLHQDYTSISYLTRADLRLLKLNRRDHTEAIAGIGFRLTGVSVYGNECNLTRISDENGYIDFENIEEGSYLLRETITSDDWLPDNTAYTVQVNAEGQVTISALSYDVGLGRFIIENTPRIHGDLRFYKVSTPLLSDSGTRARIVGVTFMLSGTSDYGTIVNEMATSEANGQVLFTNLEKGTYTLSELSTTNPDFILSSDTWTVQVDNNGNASLTSSNVIQNGIYQFIENQRYYSFILYKADSDTNEALSGAEFTLSGTSALGNQVEKTVTSGENGLLSFDYLEHGNYILQETIAPSNHQLDPRTYIVKIDRYGNIEIDGLSLDTDTGYYVFPNPKSFDGTIVITKKWEDGLTGAAAENRTHPKIIIRTKELE